MGCENENISAWLDGELTDRDAGRVAAHVESCASCRETVAAFRSMSQYFTELEPDPGFIVRFRERKEALSVAPWWTWRQLAIRLVPVAAAVLLAAFAAIWASSSQESSLQELELEALGDPVALDAGPEAVLSIAFEPFPEELE